MHLENEMNIDYQLHKSFYGKIAIRTAIDLDDRIKEQFKLATIALAQQLREEGIPIKRKCSCIFIDSDSFTLNLSKKAYAEYRSICVFGIHRWPKILQNNSHILCTILEELCHYYYDLEDGVEIQYKVIDIAKKVYPTIKHENYYTTLEIDKLKALRED